MSDDSRKGRGMGNQCSAKWYDSPYWDSIEKKKKVIESPKVVEPENESLKDKQKRLFTLAY